MQNTSLVGEPSLIIGALLMKGRDDEKIERIKRSLNSCSFPMINGERFSDYSPIPELHMFGYVCKRVQNGDGNYFGDSFRFRELLSEVSEHSKSTMVSVVKKIFEQIGLPDLNVKVLVCVDFCEP